MVSSRPPKHIWAAPGSSDGWGMTWPAMLPVMLSGQAFGGGSALIIIERLHGVNQLVGPWGVSKAQNSLRPIIRVLLT